MDEILIIKTGHSETFSELEDSGICSLGDVLRTSFLVNYFNEYKITWVTDSKAISLFDNTRVNAVCWSDWPLLDLSKFKRIINLEKTFSLLDMNLEGISNQSLDYVKELSKKDDLSYQEKLCLLLKIEWCLDTYSFRKSINEGRGIGLNWKVGEKFPQKKLDKKFWINLENHLSSYSLVKWQEGFDNLNDYINWIDSVDTLISLDSLGAHIGIALNKNVICLFGPTNMNDVHIYKRGIKLDIKNLNSKEIISLIDKYLKPIN